MYEIMSLQIEIVLLPLQSGGLLYRKVTQLYTYIYSLFHYGLSQDIEYSSMCYTLMDIFYFFSLNCIHKWI